MKAVNASDIVQAVLALCKEHGGKPLLREVAEGLERELGGSGTLPVLLITPSGDAGELTKKITDLLEKKFDRPVALMLKADPAMIGGVVVQFGDERVDLSVRGALEQLEKNLSMTALS